MTKKEISKKEESKISKIQEIVMQVGVDVAKKGEGALFVISDNVKYKRLLKQKFQPFSVFEKGAKKILLTIGMIDGAVIIGNDGVVREYGAMIKPRGVFRGFGTRHSAAFSASLYPDSTAILVSQEEKKIKVFKKGRLVIQIDAMEKNVKENISEISHILESAGFGTLSSIGVATAAAAGLIPFGISILPGILIFGIPYYVIKKIKNVHGTIPVPKFNSEKIKINKKDLIKKKDKNS